MNTFGHLFRITTWGESHGGAVGVVVDGCPPCIPITPDEIQFELDRRRPGQSKLVTQRKESDTVHILSGVFEGQTLGTPILMLVWNEDARPEAYESFKHLYRPSHADYTYQAKYGIRNWQGGGRSSARETVGRVAAGALAKKVLRTLWGVEVLAWVEQIHTVEAQVDPDAAEKMMRRIEQVRKQGDSVGGVIRCIARNVPPGWGSPVFDKLEADLAKAVMSLPASKGFEIGSGFRGSRMRGSEHNDEFYTDEFGRIRTRTNFSGGVQGGISNGERIDIRVAFKPTPRMAIIPLRTDAYGRRTGCRCTSCLNPQSRRRLPSQDNGMC
jgi:chorismate synthase